MTDVAECRSGKRAYSEEAAREVLARAQGKARRNPRRHEFRVYLCGFCLQWHLSSQAYHLVRGRRGGKHRG